MNTKSATESSQQSSSQQQYKQFEKLTAKETLSELQCSNKGLSSEQVRQRLATYGPNTITEKHVSLWRRLFLYFWGPIPWMIEIAAILSAFDRDWKSFFIIIVMLVINGGIGFWEEKSASDALDALKGQLALKARALRDGAWQEVNADGLVPGDIVRLRLGDVAPADVKLLEGEYLSIDQSALTGESLPVTKKVDDPAYSGTLIKEGEMVAVVYATGSDTFFGKTAKLVESAGAESHFQKAVLRIGNILIASAGALSALLVLVEITRGVPLLTLLSFVLIVVVASIPVALPAVLSVTMALGALALSKMKAIVSRLESIEEMAGVDVLCSDKTGTLTQNKLTLGDPVVLEGGDSAEVVLCGALASKGENQDAIDNAVIHGLKNRDELSRYAQKDFVPFDPTHKRTEATVETQDGKKFKVSKGAPQVISDMCHPQEEILQKAQATVDDAAKRGFRTLGVARSLDDGESWQYLGILPLYDPPREDSKQTIREAHEHGIAVKMVTGDNVAIAREISQELGMGSKIQSATALLEYEKGGRHAEAQVARAIEMADGFAEVFPEHKYAIVKSLQDSGHIVAMTGDGVNDAPALKQAEVGIAVSGATDAARSAASLILTAPGLSVIIRAVEEARRIFHRMMSYTIYRVAMTLSIMVFVVLTMLIYRDFPLTTIMIILLALLDDIPIMTIAWDNADLSPKPVRWEMNKLMVVSVMLGALALAQSFVLYLLAKYTFHIDLAQTQTLMFLRFIVGGHLLLFVTRTRRPFWKRPFPSWQLLLAITLTQIVGVLFVGLGWLMSPISWTAIGLIWAYDIAWMLVMDFAKIGTYRLIEHKASHHLSFLRSLQMPLHFAGHGRDRAA